MTDKNKRQKIISVIRCYTVVAGEPDVGKLRIKL